MTVAAARSLRVPARVDDALRAPSVDLWEQLEAEVHARLSAVSIADLARAKEGTAPPAQN